MDVDFESSGEEEQPQDVSRSVFVQDVEGLISYAQGSLDLNAGFKLYECGCDRALLVLLSSCTLHFYGSVRIACLNGKAEILGRILEPSKPPVEAFSYKGFSALYVATVEADSEEVAVDVSAVSSYGLPFMEATKIRNLLKTGGCILLLEELNSKKLRLELDSPHSRIKNRIDMHPGFRLDLVSGVTVVCGGQGVGKSTSLRFLSNRALNQVESVLYLDLDPGQPEFTLHECVSAILVKHPLLGPSYTHFTRPVFSFNVSNIDVSRCVDTYLRAVELLVEKCRTTYPDIPWLVNTMGFSRGVGVYITSCCLAILNPSLVIQIDGEQSRNFPADLTPKYVEETSKRSVCSYKLTKVFVGNRKVNRTRSSHFHSNKEIRHIATQHYFSSQLRPSYPLVIPSQCIKVFNVIDKTLIIESNYGDLVGKLVVLSSSDTIDEPPQMIDFGVILEYVASTESLLILTPLEESSAVCNLSSVLVGSLQFPSRLVDPVHPLTSGIVPFCQIQTPGAKASAPTLKTQKKTYRFLFEPSFKQAS